MNFVHTCTVVSVQRKQWQSLLPGASISPMKWWRNTLISVLLVLPHAKFDVFWGKYQMVGGFKSRWKGNSSSLPRRHTEKELKPEVSSKKIIVETNRARKTAEKFDFLSPLCVKRHPKYYTYVLIFIQIVNKHTCTYLDVLYIYF